MSVRMERMAFTVCSNIVGDGFPEPLHPKPDCFYDFQHLCQTTFFGCQGELRIPPLLALGLGRAGSRAQILPVFYPLRPPGIMSTSGKLVFLPSVDCVATHLGSVALCRLCGNIGTDRKIIEKSSENY